MRVDVAGVVAGSPTIKGKSASFRLAGGGPFLYGYGAFGEEIVSNIREGSQIIATGSVNYGKSGDGEWEKYINLTGSVTFLPNRKISDDEKAKITFVSTGVVTNITPQSTKTGNMAKFTIEETSVDFRGELPLKHSMVAFGSAADVVLSLDDGQPVMVAGDVSRIKGRGDKWYTSFNATAVVPVEVEEPKPRPENNQPQAQSQSGGINEDDLPF